MTILFDLDGTLTDSGEGIINSVKLVFSHFHMPIPSATELRTFIGPPLESQFPIYGIPADRIQEAVDVFRSRYNTIGKFENAPYPRISEILQLLRDSGCHLYVATSKPERTAKEVLLHFGLDSFFHGIFGATMDSSRVTKSQVIRYLLDHAAVSTPVIMVGDTAFDVVGARQFDIPTIGVSWGYGTIDSLQQAGAVAIADVPEQLPALILDHAQLHDEQR